MSITLDSKFAETSRDATHYRMRNSDWLEIWQEDHTPFHQDKVSALLKKHIRGLKLKADDEIFVPLCGKSLDMQWLATAGFNVLGVELSAIAISSFFESDSLTASKLGPFKCWNSGRIKILEGDFFNLSADHLQNVKAVWDVAALVALTPKLRHSYADLMIKLLPPSVSYLLLSFDFDQSFIEGPPFSVPASEVKELFGERFEIKLIDTDSQLPKDSPLREKGLKSMLKSLFALRDKA